MDSPYACFITLQTNQYLAFYAFPSFVQTFNADDAVALYFARPTRFAGDKIAGGVKPEEFDAFHEVKSAFVSFRLLWCLDCFALNA